MTFKWYGMVVRQNSAFFTHKISITALEQRVRMIIVTYTSYTDTVVHSYMYAIYGFVACHKREFDYVDY